MTHLELLYCYSAIDSVALTEYISLKKTALESSVLTFFRSVSKLFKSFDRGYRLPQQFHFNTLYNVEMFVASCVRDRLVTSQLT